MKDHIYFPIEIILKTGSRGEGERSDAIRLRFRFLIYTWKPSPLFDKFSHETETGQPNIIKD